MESCPTIRRVATLLILFLAATETYRLPWQRFSFVLRGGEFQRRLDSHKRLRFVH